MGGIEIYQHIDTVRQWITKIRFSVVGSMSVLLVFVVAGAFLALHIEALKPIKKMINVITSPNIVEAGKLTRKIDGGGAPKLQSLDGSFTSLYYLSLTCHRTLIRNIFRMACPRNF